MDYRKIGLGLAAFAAGAALWVIGIAQFGPKPGGSADAPEPAPGDRAGAAAAHVPTDLMGDRRPAAGDRAPVAFRPDPTAIPTPEERESLRPATGAAPTLVADRGTGFGTT